MAVSKAGETAAAKEAQAAAEEAQAAEELHIFCLIDIYTPNQGSDRLDLFQRVPLFVKQCGQDERIVMGGDWNSTTDYTMYRIGLEPHLQSRAWWIYGGLNVLTSSSTHG